MKLSSSPAAPRSYIAIYIVNEAKTTEYVATGHPGPFYYYFAPPGIRDWQVISNRHRHWQLTGGDDEGADTFP
jgi:hypothetical protein